MTPIYITDLIPLAHSQCLASRTPRVQSCVNNSWTLQYTIDHRPQLAQQSYGIRVLNTVYSWIVCYHSLIPL